MKKYLYPVLLFLLAMSTGTLSIAQVKGDGILSRYYVVKDALVEGNAPVASTGADEMIKEINKFDLKLLPADLQKSVQSLFAKLLADANLISSAKDINKQREHFASLSNAMISLAKKIKLNLAPVYIDYCPMKKSYWLSAEQAIKNPYYGSSMLVCGNVTDSLK